MLRERPSNQVGWAVPTILRDDILVGTTLPATKARGLTSQRSSASRKASTAIGIERSSASVARLFCDTLIANSPRALGEARNRNVVS